MRFSLIDRIVEIEAGKSVTAVKSLSLAEEYLADHFPGKPVMPGVLMLESMVQASAWLIRYSEDFKHSVVLLKQARAVRFNSFVTPGNTLTVSSQLQKQDDRECTVKASGHVDGTPTVSARLTLERFNLSENNSSMADSDEQRIIAMKDLFDQLWDPSDTETSGPDA